MKRWSVFLTILLVSLMTLLIPDPVVALSGGPDPYGYTYADSNEPGGPDATFEDISGVGMQITFDDFYEAVALPFAFPFYGGAYTQAYLYGDCAWCWNNWTHIAFGAPDFWSYGSVWWMDYIDRDSGAIYVYSDTLSSPQRFIVQYDGVYNYYSGATTTSQVILYEDGNILVRYDSDFSWWNSYWGNMQPELYSPGYGWFTYASYPQDNLAVQFYPPPDYDVTLSPTAISNGGQPGSLVYHWLTLMNTGLNDDTYDLSVTGATWLTEILDDMYNPIAQVSNLPSHSAVNVVVRVTVPPSLSPGAFDVATVTATSTTSPTVSAQSVVTTRGPGVPATVAVTAAPNYTAPGGGTSDITAEVRDAYGQVVLDGTVVIFTVPFGSVSPTSATTVNGIATTTFTSDAACGNVVLTADAGTAQGTTHITVGNGPTYINGGAGDINSDTTWTACAGPYIVEEMVIVQAGVALTIEAGTVLQFNWGTGLHVLGALTATGQSTNTVLFTSNGSYWYGLAFGDDSNAGSGLLDYVTVEYAGQWICAWPNTGWCDSAAVLVYNGGSPDITNSVIRNNNGYGLYLRNGAQTIQENLIQANNNWGIYAEQSSLPTILTNTIASNNGGGVYLQSQSGLNVTNQVITAGVDGGVTWQYNIGWPGDSWEQPSYDDSWWSSGLTPIGDSGTYPQVNTPADWDWDYLYARHTFNLTAPLADEYRLRVGRDDMIAGIWVNGVDVYGWEYGCYSGNDWINWISVGQYLHVGANTIAVRIYNGWCGGSEYFDLELAGGTVLYPLLQGNTIASNNGYGLYAPSPSEPLVQGNAFTDNASYPLYIGANSVPEAAAGNTLSGNNPNVAQVFGQAMTRDRTWDLPIAYYEIVNPQVTVNSGVTLTIPAGTEARFNGSTGVHVLGTLNAIGDALNPILLTSTGGGPGSWYGLAFGDNSNAGSGALEYVTVEYAGQWNCWPSAGCYEAGVLVHNGGSPDITNSVIRNNNGYGLYLRNGAQTIQENLIQANNNWGIYAEQSSLPTILTNTIASNNGGGVYLRSEPWFDPVSRVITAGVDGGVTWQYNIGWPGDYWEQPGYNDSWWSSGLTPIGDSSAYPQVNTPADWDGDYLYTRHTFNLTAPLADEYRLRVGRDDMITGIWVNGVDVYGWEYGCYSGNDWINWISVGQYLHVGANTIAVRIYNGWCWGSEYFDLELAEGTLTQPLVQGNTIEVNNDWGLYVNTSSGVPSILTNTIASNTNGGLYLHAPLLPFVPAGAVVTAGLDGGVTWQYNVGWPGDYWEQPSYDDSGWNNGLTPIGDSGTYPQVQTSVDWGDWTWGDLYARYTFNLTAPLAEEYRLRVGRDDNIAGIWINGISVYSDYYWNCYNGNNWIDWISVYPYLHEGSNTIAVQIRNDSCVGAEYFDLELIDGYFTRAQVQGNTLRENANYGLYLNNSSSFIQDNAIYNNTVGGAGFNAAGIWMESDSDPILSGNAVYGNARGGIYANNTDDRPRFIGHNSIYDNGGYPLRLSADRLREVQHMMEDGSLTLYGNTVKGIILNGESLTQDTTFSNTAEINLYYLVNNYVQVNTGVTLTVEPGVVVKAQGPGLAVYGTLSAPGTESAPIYFTSHRDDRSGGDANLDGFTLGSANDWGGLRFNNPSVGALDYAVVKCADWNMRVYWGSVVTATNSLFANGQGGVYVNDSSPTLHHNTIRNNSDHGLRVEGWSAAPSIRNNTLRLNGANLGVYSWSQPLVEYNNLYDSLNYDLGSDATVVGAATVRYNWLGEYPPDVETYNGPLTDTAPLKALRPTIAESTLAQSDPSPTKAGVVTVTIDFNREMDTDYDPTVTFGTLYPYTTYAVTPLGWTGLFTWTGEVTITDTTGDGAYTFAVSAARDRAGSVLDAFSVSTFPMDRDIAYTFMVDTVPPVMALDVPTYTNALAFDVGWSANDATSGVAPGSFDVQYSLDGVAWTDWLTQTATTSQTFGALLPVPTTDGAYYHFHARAADLADNVADYSAGAAILVDTTAPTSTIDALPPYAISADVVVTWSGDDPSSGTPSGIAAYDIYTSADGATFNLWQTTSDTQATYSGVNGERVWFYTLARDNAGNIEATPAFSTQILIDLVAPNSAVAALSVYTTTPSITVSWSGSDPTASEASGLAAFDVYVTSTLVPAPTLWLYNVTSTTAQYDGQDGVQYGFYTVARDNAGNGEAAPAQADAVILVDTTPPTSAVDALPIYGNQNTFTVSWAGDDPSTGIASGLATFDVFVSTDGTTFTPWLTDTALTSALYTGSGASGSYWFYSLATDNAGLVQAAPTYTATTLVDLEQPASAVGTLPMYRGVSFAVAWSGSDTGGSGVLDYTVYYTTSLDATPVAWLLDTTDTSAMFTGAVDGVTYYFYSIARDQAGNVEDATGPDAHTSIDITPPASAVDGLPTYTANLTFTVSWDGTDATAGVASYDVYSSTAGVTYHLWLADTTATNAVFSGVNGQTYFFYSRAMDHAGNEEAAPATPDAMTLVDVAAPVSAASSPVYSTAAAFAVTWTGSDAESSVASYDVYVAVDGGAYTRWLTATTATSAVFIGTHGQTYHFYSRATDAAGNVEAAPASADTGTLVDLVAPTSAVAALPAFVNTTAFSVTWSGSDATSGVAHYDVYVSDNSAPYALWQAGVIVTEATYSGAVNGHTYRFYSRATDAAGNVEAAPAAADAQTTISLDTPTSVVSPLLPYQTTNNFLVMWSGSDPVWGVRDYTIYVSVDGGLYTAWLTDTALTAAYYTGAHWHTYAFYSRARNNAGVVEDAPASADATTMVDTVRPTSAVSALPRYSTIPTLTVAWNGSDNGSGLAFYDVYMSDTGASFEVWQPNVIITTAQHLGEDGHEYAFYSLATDNAGNVQERPTRVPFTLVDLTPPASQVAVLPPLQHTLAFTVTWGGDDPSAGVPSGVDTYDVYVSIDGGAYTLWQSAVSFTEAVFTGVNKSVYRFYSLARDKAGNVETVPAVPDAETQLLTEVTLTINVEGPGTTTPAPGVYTYTYDTNMMSVVITATPNVGASFLGWSGGLSGAANPATVLMDGDKVVTATFTTVVIPTYTLTMAVQGNGTVTPAAGPHVYNENTVVPITATAAAGWQFAGWLGDVANANAAHTTVTMNANKTVIANFAQTNFPIFLPLVMRNFGN